MISYSQVSWHGIGGELGLSYTGARSDTVYVVILSWMVRQHSMMQLKIDLSDSDVNAPGKVCA